jgi:zinc protease
MKRAMRTTGGVLGVALLVLAVTAPGAAARKKPWEKFDYPALGKIEMPDYERYELPNGMVVYLAEDHEFPLIELSATIRTGSIYEPADKVGLAEITGRVLRTGGTDSHTGDEIDEMVESRGMNLETWIGGTEGGAYLSALPEDAELGLQLLAEILRRPRFDEDKIDLAKKEQKASIARRNDEPMSIVQREAPKIIFGPDHPLARQTEYATIDAITRQDLQAFHERFFHPDYTYLVVIGDFDTPGMKQQLAAVFGDWERSGEPLPSDPEIPQLPPTVNVIDKSDLTQSTVVVAHVGIRADDPHYAGIMVANRILGSGFSSRLFNEVRSKRGYAYAVGSTPGTGFRFPGVFLAYCGTKSSTTQDAIKVMIEQIEKMTHEPVSEEELVQARDGILNSDVFNYDTKREVLDRLVMYEMYGYPADFLQRYREAVATLTPQDVLEAAQAVWHPDRLSILALGNRADWDGDLSTLGKVNEIDITIPQPASELEIPAPTAESLQEGQRILASVAQAVAGKRKLSAIQGWREQMNLTAEIQGMGSMNIGVVKTVVLPDRIHVVQKLPFGEMTVVVDGDTGWMKGPMGEQDLPASQLSEQKEELRQDILMLLRDREQLQAQALAPEEMDGQAYERVYLTGLGDGYVLLYVDPQTHLPHVVQTPGTAPMTNAPVTQQVVAEEYATMAGVQVVKRFTIKHDGEVFATGTLDEFMIDPKVEEGLFQK